jgi:hypothetical protein
LWFAVFIPHDTLLPLYRNAQNIGAACMHVQHPHPFPLGPAQLHLRTCACKPLHSHATLTIALPFGVHTSAASRAQPHTPGSQSGALHVRLLGWVTLLGQCEALIERAP